MGFALDGDVHLYPEETLFLVERCKLEVGNVTTPQLYEGVDLLHYLAYSYFKQTSLIVFRAEPFVPGDGEQDAQPIPPPPGVAFEAYAPTAQFAKKNRGRPIMYIMYGGCVKHSQWLVDESRFTRWHLTLHPHVHMYAQHARAGPDGGGAGAHLRVGAGRTAQVRHDLG